MTFGDSTQVNPQCFDAQCYPAAFPIPSHKGTFVWNTFPPEASLCTSYISSKYCFHHLGFQPPPRPQLSLAAETSPTFHWLKRICVSPAQASLQSPRIIFTRVMILPTPSMSHYYGANHSKITITFVYIV